MFTLPNRHRDALPPGLADLYLDADLRECRQLAAQHVTEAARRPRPRFRVVASRVKRALERAHRAVENRVGRVFVLIGHRPNRDRNR